jgi:hypothetical protein
VFIASYYQIINVNVKLTLADSIILDKVGIFRHTFSITSVLVNLYETIRALKAVFVLRAEAFIAGRMATHTDIVSLIIVETN